MSNKTPTAHISAKLGDVAPTVLMPGDPLRAKFIAENFLSEAVCFNEVRGMLGYTGKYKGKSVSVMGSGMGMPSIGIYSYELFNFYDVQNIIRVGTAGGMSEEVKIRDVVLAMGASTESNYVSQYRLPGTFAPIADFDLLSTAVEHTKKQGVSYRVGNVYSSDIFYNASPEYAARFANLGILCVEMESAALYMNAAFAKKRALGLFTISDHLLTGESTTSEERQSSFTDMMEIALNTAVDM